MKTTLALTTLLAIALIPSCAQKDPGYEQYKAEQAAQQQAAQSAMTGELPSPTETNPYAAPAATNPYAAPVNQPVNQPANQYPTLPPLPGGGSVQNTVNMGNLPAPVNNTFNNSSSHTVVSGDTIWGLSKKYNVSQSAILEANGLSSNMIRIGQEVIIPQP